MTEQWIRAVSLTIGDDKEALDVSQLRIRFDIRHAVIATPGYADITITNLSTATVNRVLHEYTGIVLQAGYEDNIDVIFTGDIVQKFAGRENATDTYLRIIATESPKAHWFATISKTLAAGSTFRDQVDACLEALKPFGVVAGYIADLPAATMPRGVAMFGMVRDKLRDICQATTTQWHIRDGKLNIVKVAEPLPGEALVLTSRTGLVGLPVRTFDGIEARCLLNPRIRPGSLVKIDQASVQDIPLGVDINSQVRNSQLPWTADDGLYAVLTVDVLGDSRGNEWFTDIVCMRADFAGPPPENLTDIGPTLYS